MTMVEKVARAIDCDIPAMMGTNLDELSPEKWKEHRHQHFIRMARAAIEAYEAHLAGAGLVIAPREPTEAMLRAADSAGIATSGYGEGENIELDSYFGEQFYTAMIDAAPKEKEG